VSHEAALTGLPKRFTRRCKCGRCFTCTEDERWQQIFNEKFADPHYYTADYVRQPSPLTDC
jgi:hypothetical protein